MRTLRVLLVDDDRDFLELAMHDLGKLPNVEVVATARSGDKAVTRVRVVEPDPVLMDIDMPGMNGVPASVAAEPGLSPRRW